MSELVLQVFALLGALAAVATIWRFSFWLWERRATRLVVQCWWEATLDPVARKRFRRSLSVGLREPEIWGGRRWWSRHMEVVQGLGRWDFSDEVWHHLVEPARPLSVRHADADGAWALRTLIYNRGPHPLPSEDVDGIDVTVPEPSGIRVLSWQADDGRLIIDRTRNRDTESVTDTLHLPTTLRRGQKVRDEVAVIFNSNKNQRPPDVKVVIRAHVKTKVKLYRPSMTKLEAGGRLVVRFLRTISNRLGMTRKRAD